MDISSQDWQLLSEYIDGELSSTQKSRLEERLDADQRLREAYQRLRNTKQVLRSTPQLSAPRRFTLTPEMVGQAKPRSLFPVFRLATAVISILLVAVLVYDFSGIVLPSGEMAPRAPVAQRELAEGSNADKSAGQPEAESAQVESLAQETREETKMAEEEEMEEEAVEEEAGVMAAETPTPTPALTETPLPPPPTDLPLTDQPVQDVRQGFSTLKVIEVILVGLIIVSAAGMYLTRKRK